jgi:hypothetical protein
LFSIVVFVAMGKFGKKLFGAFKKAMGASSSCSRGSSSAHYSAEHSKSPMHEDKEAAPTEEQEHQIEVEDDAPYLDLEGDRELQEYVLIKDREFVHTPAYDMDLLEKICMDVEFFAVWKAIR